MLCHHSLYRLYSPFVTKSTDNFVFDCVSPLAQVLSTLLLEIFQMPGWSVGDIKNELASVAKLLKARPGVFQLESKLCHALKNKLGLLSMGPCDLVVCYEAIKEADLPEAVQSELTEVLDGLAIEASSSKVAVTSGMAQECINFQNFITENDLDSLGQTSMWQGADILARRMKMLGISNMKEGVKKTACALLVWLENQRTGKMPNGDTAYSLSHHLVNTLKDLPMEVPEGACKLADYPDKPSQLDTDHGRASYPDVPGLAIVRKKSTPVRNTSALVTTEPWFFFSSFSMSCLGLLHFCCSNYMLLF